MPQAYKAERPITANAMPGTGAAKKAAKSVESDRKKKDSKARDVMAQMPWNQKKKTKKNK